MFKRHIPNFVDGKRPTPYIASTLDEILRLPFIRQMQDWKDHKFKEWAKAEDMRAKL